MPKNLTGLVKQRSPCQKLIGAFSRKFRPLNKVEVGMVRNLLKKYKYTQIMDAIDQVSPDVEFPVGYVKSILSVPKDRKEDIKELLSDILGN